jgi:hypothetical protein
MERDWPIFSFDDGLRSRRIISFLSFGSCLNLQESNEGKGGCRNLWGSLSLNFARSAVDEKPDVLFMCLKTLVGERGFEPPTPRSEEPAL